MKHNKKRNTAFIYEILIKELSKASMHKLEEKKNKIVNLLKMFFSKGMPLREELEIYQSLANLSGERTTTIEKIISEARSQSEKINRKLADEKKTKLINLINKQVGQDAWDTFVKDYKHMATINQAIFCKTNPKKQIFLEEKLIKLVEEGQNKKQPFPVINKLTLNTFLEKFNKEYGDVLKESQKKLLNKYITSYKDNGLELKIFLYEEIDRLKEKLEKATGPKKDNSAKINLILEKVQSYSKKNIDRNMITEIIKIQSLVEEFDNGN